MTAPSPHTHPAERETPAGEAMREAVGLAERILVGGPPCSWNAVDARKAWQIIASELARLTAEREGHLHLVGRLRESMEAAHANADEAMDQAAAAEAALTTQRADHAAEVARKNAEIADLRGALEDTKAAADDLAQVCLNERDNKAAGALQFISGFISDRFAALAPKETTDA